MCINFLVFTFSYDCCTFGWLDDGSADPKRYIPLTQGRTGCGASNGVSPVGGDQDTESQVFCKVQTGMHVTFDLNT